MGLDVLEVCFFSFLAGFFSGTGGGLAAEETCKLLAGKVWALAEVVGVVGVLLKLPELLALVSYPLLKFGLIFCSLTEVEFFLELLDSLLDDPF